MTKQTIIPSIIKTIRHNGGTFKGTRRLAEKIGAQNHVTRVMNYCRLLEQRGEITISRSKGGRGNRTVFEFRVTS